VPTGKPVRIIHGDVDYVLFRDAGGICRALIDRCAHRRAALSGGRITDQFVLECPYHGWRYEGTTGACVAIPNLRADEKIPNNYRVQPFGTLERDGFIQLSLGAGENPDEPNDVSIPNLERHWEGSSYLAYPEPLFMDTLVDCPSSLVSISGIRILDDHALGDPAFTAELVSIEYAAVKSRRTSRAPKQVVADFPFTVRIDATKSAARVAVYCSATAQLCALALVIAVPTGERLTRALWRGAETKNSAGSMTIECRAHVDPAP
jgi:nitrite reductase/ring-hydroxylating ferredoxin subunit